MSTNRRSPRNVLSSLIMSSGSPFTCYVTDNEEVVGNKHYVELLAEDQKSTVWMDVNQIISIVPLDKN